MVPLYLSIDSLPVVNNHPEGSDVSQKSLADMLMELIRDNKNVIVLDDFNVTQTSPFRNIMTSKLTDG